MKKYFFGTFIILSFFLQIGISFAQTALTLDLNDRTFLSRFNNNISFNIKIQDNENAVTITSATTGTDSYKITASIVNQDKKDINFIPIQIGSIINPKIKSNIFFDSLTLDHQYRITILGKKITDTVGDEGTLGDFSFVDNITSPKITDNLVASVGGTTEVRTPVNSSTNNIQQNGSTNYSAPVKNISSTGSITPTSAAVGGLITCSRFQGDTPCGLVEFFNLLNRLIKFAIQDIFFPIFIFAILYLGYTFITAQGSTDAWTKAKKMAWNMILGVLMILGAWLVVYTALTVLGANDAVMFFKK